MLTLIGTNYIMAYWSLLIYKQGNMRHTFHQIRVAPQQHHFSVR